MTDSPKAKNLYLVFTPYHLLLTLIHDDRTVDDLVIMVDDHGKLQDYEIVGSKLFANFRYINMAAGGTKILARQLRLSIGNRRKIDAMVKKSISDSIVNTYVFNDVIPTGQYLIKKAKSKTVYIEDGSAPYNEHTITWSLRHRLTCWLAYGFRYQFVKVIGTSSLIDESLFLNPTLVRAENRIKPYRQLSIKSDYLKAIGKMAQNFLACNDVNMHKNESAVLILLPRVTTMPTDFIDKLRGLIERLNDQGWVLYLKKHPLDCNVYKDLGLKVDCEILPSSIPAEVAPVLLDCIKIVIGKETTSLLAIKFLFPNLKIVNLIDDKEVQSRYQKVLANAGVFMAQPSKFSL